jgi:hypothetical protein
MADRKQRETDRKSWDKVSLRTYFLQLALPPEVPEPSKTLALGVRETSCSNLQS